MHAIIPVAGKGTRMRPLTWSVPKVLLRLAGNTMLGHILDELAESGVDHVTLIVGYLGDEIVDWTRKHYPDMKVDYARQEKMDGLASAVNLASPVTGSDPTLVVLGDTVFDADISQALDPGRNMIAVKKVEDPRRFGVVVTEGERVVKLVEKPAEFVSDLAIVGIYGFSSGNSLMEATSRLIGSGRRTRGEFQLTDAMQLMLEDGQEFGCFEVQGWYDCGKPETVLETNRRLLEGGRSRGPGRAVNSVIIDPVHIEDGVEIESSIIGPYVSVASGTVISSSIVSDSVIGQRASISNVPVRSSIIGNDAEVSSGAASVFVGSSSKIEL